MAKNEFLRSRHPIHQAQAEYWFKQERRFRGGMPLIKAELWPFDWEQPNGEHIRRRRDGATYINFPDLFLRTVIGHLLARAPKPDASLHFGSLGTVSRGEGRREPSRAELVYYNVDGRGQDGSEWNPFWGRVMQWAGVTGHRWVMVDAPRQAPMNERDEQRGLRPYCVHYSPLAVTNWHFEDGTLAMAIIRKWRRRLRLGPDGQLMGNSPEPVYMLMTRAGWDGFGEQYAEGGWWEFDKDLKLIEGAHGTWEKTRGEIPMVPVYFERDEGEEPVPGVDMGDVYPSMSRSGTFDLGQLANSYMNMASAADFDAIDAAASIAFLTGVSREAHNLAMATMKNGSRFVPLPGDPEMSGVRPEVHDGSMGAVAAEVFARRLEMKRREAVDIAAFEASGSPESSGMSKKAGFADVKAPILSRLAGELGQAQNTILRFLELRFGSQNPTAYVEWPQEFDLEPLVNDIVAMFELERLTGYRSTSLGANLMVRAAQEYRLLRDEDVETVQREYEESADQAASRQWQQDNLFTQFGLGQ